MHELTPSNTLAFLRRFRLKGGVIRRFTLRNTAADSVALKLLLTVTDGSTNDKVKLAVVVRDVEEYRFQKRATMNVFAIREVRIGTFDGITFLNLDADPADPAPKPMDYRISDCFVAGRRISWEVINPKN
ncbi:hypothetical protein [Zavarzinella formosa]|uniref:hypothetical protein n=1 Tax=Zavarzinella formosa TaxID=360055 RepID=UPI0002E55C6B|nr:hypothetical protein [Zavarzinella formosa]